MPLSEAAVAAVAADPTNLATVLTGGDDYEILCTLPPERVDAFARAAKAAGVPVGSIGTIVAGNAAPRFTDKAGREIALGRLSYSHF